MGTPLSLWTIKGLMEIMMGKSENDIGIPQQHIYKIHIPTERSVLTLQNQQMMNGSLLNCKRRGLSPRSRLPEGWIAVGNRGRKSESQLDPHSHMIQVSLFVYQKSQNCRGQLVFKTIFALEACILENMSRYTRHMFRARMNWD